MRSRSSWIALALVAVSAAALSAQQTPNPNPRPRAGTPRAMMRMAPGQGAGFGPAARLLRMREVLSLTDDQVSRLEALARKQQARPTPHAADVLRARADLLQATEGEIDVGAARAALERMSKLRIDAAVAGLQAAKDARAILTPEQRTRMQGVERRMMARFRAMRRGGNGDRGGSGFGGRAGGRGMMPGMLPGMGRGMMPGMMPGMGRGMMPGMGRGMMPDGFDMQHGAPPMPRMAPPAPPSPDTTGGR